MSEVDKILVAINTRRPGAHGIWLEGSAYVIFAGVMSSVNE